MTPSSFRLATGADLQFTATGTYSNGTAANLTGSVTWSSSKTSVATIDPTGLAHGVAKGSSTIKAVLGGISGSTLLSIRT